MKNESLNSDLGMPASMQGSLDPNLVLKDF